MTPRLPNRLLGEPEQQEALGAPLKVPAPVPTGGTQGPAMAALDAAALGRLGVHELLPPGLDGWPGGSEAPGSDLSPLALPVVTVRATDSAAAEVAVGETANPGRFTLTRTGDLSQALTVTYVVQGTATGGQDYVALSGTVTFQAGSDRANIALNVLDDAVFEGNETVTIRLVDGTAYDLGAAQQATVTIADDDPAPLVTVRATDAAAAEVAAGGAANPGRFTLTRTGDLSQSLTVTYVVEGTATNGQDYRTLKGTVTFQAGSDKATVAVNVLDDAVFEGDETVTLRLVDGARYDLGAANQATVTIRDNDTAPPQAPGIALAGQFGGSGDDIGMGIAVGPNGKVWVTGTSTTAWSAVRPSPDDLGLNDGTTDGWVASFDAGTGAQLGAIQRVARPMDGPIFQGGKIYYGYTNDMMTGVATDAAGNAVVVGTLVYRGLIANNGDPSTPDDNTSQPIENNDIFIAKFRPDGSVMWSKVIHQTLDDRAQDVQIDASGNIYVAGSYNQDEYGRPTPFGATLSKFDANGNLLWTRGVGDNLAEAEHVSVGADGFVYVAGNYWEYDWQQPGLDNAFVAKYRANGTLEWAQPLVRTDGFDRVTGFDTDAAGNGYAAVVTTDYVNSVEVMSFSLARMNTNGTVAWVKQEASARHSYADLEVGADGFLYVAGAYREGDTLLQGFVRKIDPARATNADGGLVWETRLGAVDNPAGVANLEFGPGGEIWVTGTAGGATWGAARGGADAFFARLTSGGGQLLDASAGVFAAGSVVPVEIPALDPFVFDWQNLA